MLQYSIDFFDRALRNIHHDSAGDISIDDDYISFQRNKVVVRYTDVDLKDAYIYIERDDYSFFGVVTSVEPTKENTIEVSFKNFLAVFDEPVLFDTDWQLQDTEIEGVSELTNEMSLEETIEELLLKNYVDTDDLLQVLPISVTPVTETWSWGFNLISDAEEQHYCVVGLYSTVIVEAMKSYGIAIQVSPNFRTGVINLDIVNQSTLSAINVDGNLPNVEIKTLKTNDRPNGVNKLTVYNADDFSQSIDFYVFTDMSWGIDPDEEGKVRIFPVVRDVRTATPDSTMDDPAEAFSLAAVDVAHGVLSGLEWDNLIELEVATDDPLIQPIGLKFGQRISLWYKGTQYVSILTGKKMSTKGTTLTFGSERIQITKRLL